MQSNIALFHGNLARIPLELGENRSKQQEIKQISLDFLDIWVRILDISKLNS